MHGQWVAFWKEWLTSDALSTKIRNAGSNKKSEDRTLLQVYPLYPDFDKGFEKVPWYALRPPGMRGPILNWSGWLWIMDDREYQKQYWKKNKKKIQAKRRERREELNAYQKEYYRKNRKKLLKYMRKWRKENQDKIQGYTEKRRKKKWPNANNSNFLCDKSGYGHQTTWLWALCFSHQQEIFYKGVRSAHKET